MLIPASIVRRCQLLWLHLFVGLRSITEWASARRRMAMADERGLTALEYVALGAVVVVAAGAVGALVAAFLHAKAGQIIGTP